MFAEKEVPPPPQLLIRLGLAWLGLAWLDFGLACLWLVFDLLCFICLVCGMGAGGEGGAAPGCTHPFFFVHDGG